MQLCFLFLIYDFRVMLWHYPYGLNASIIRLLLNTHLVYKENSKSEGKSWPKRWKECGLSGEGMLLIKYLSKKLQLMVYPSYGRYLIIVMMLSRLCHIDFKGINPKHSYVPRLGHMLLGFYIIPKRLLIRCQDLVWFTSAMLRGYFSLHFSAPEYWFSHHFWRLQDSWSMD